MTPTPADILKKIKASAVFKAWEKKHSGNFLSHFFCPITAQCEFKSDWEVGFYVPDADKIAVFACGEAVALKQSEEDVFKKPEQSVEELDLRVVKVSFADAVKIFASGTEELFPAAQRGDGFVILQVMNKKTLWNFTFITKALKFINIKINAETREIDSHMDLDLIDRKKD